MGFGGPKVSRSYYLILEPQKTSLKWMFGETPIFHVKIWNHPIETTFKKWLFMVPGSFVGPTSEAK